MNYTPLYIIRLSCTDLESAVSWYIDQGFKSLCFEEEIAAVWIEKEELILCITQSATDSPALVGYWEKPDEAVKKMEELGVVFNFSADAMGDHFEAHFTDPAGLPVIIADKYDLPKEITSSVIRGELTVPSAHSFQDSVNFWHSLGFEIQPGGAQPHAWSVLKHGNMTVGIHQSMNWEKPGICFPKEVCPLETEVEALLDIKVYEKVKIGRSADGCRIYRLGG